ncbi:sulfatase-like hydrolase/transferase [Reichenbachiella versicolor]|uniref:sulfatase-like hydrolase/transferase n=1 Tax=Reichenbachiella versicolor TaxID=1821036 RepID=UPI000D6E9CA2|nr:sulfatase-like hydrolase/transferase [Reichenbachiella versicolor]
MRIFKITIFLLASFLVGCQSSIKKAEKESSQQNESKRPNILIILADDMGYGDIGVYGSEISTPNIDQLANEGIQFTNFHVGAACSPTRTMLMTGVDNHRAGIGNLVEIQADNQFGKPGYEGYLNNDVVSIATRLKDGGYHTYMTGKWHLGKSKTTIPYARGFERSFALMESGADNWVEQPYLPLNDKVHYFEDNKQVSLPTENYFSSDYYTDKIMSYIDSNKGDEKPFFAYVSYQAVHYPHQAPKSFIDKYNGVYDNGWEEIRTRRLKKQKELGIVSQSVELNFENSATSVSGWKLSDWESLSEEEKLFNARRMQAYAGMADNMDYNIGRLLQHLQDIGEYNNTLIIFLSDNGADPNQLPLNPAFKSWYKEKYQYSSFEDYKEDYNAVGQKGSYSDYGPNWAAASNTPNSYYKMFSTEGGLRVPFIAWYPKLLKAGKVTNQFAFVKDIAPTLLEIAGIENSGSTYKGKKIFPITGTSMWSAMKEEVTVHADEEIIGFELAGSRAVFKGDYKLVFNPRTKGTGQWELYNIVKDPSEMNNLVADFPELVDELSKAYHIYQKENGVIPVPDDYDVLKQLVKNSKRGKSH